VLNPGGAALPPGRMSYRGPFGRFNDLPPESAAFPQAALD